MKPIVRLAAVLLLALGGVNGCGRTPSSAIPAEEGVASYYADSLHGNPTASGDPYDKEALTAAHRTLEFGTRVRVTNLENDTSVIVTINDRGPHVADRVIDLSRAAAEQLDMMKAGIASVRIEVIG